MVAGVYDAQHFEVVSPLLRIHGPIRHSDSWIARGLTHTWSSPRTATGLPTDDEGAHHEATGFSPEFTQTGSYRARKAWERGNNHERVKPLNGIQLVQIQPGQRRSGQAGSESCACIG
jgi:hypothetical protein